MYEPQVLIDSAIAGFVPPATFASQAIALAPSSSDMVSFQIYTQNIGITWDLRRSNDGLTEESFIAAYRALDPLFIDPVLLTPITNHHVAFRNPGAAFIRLLATAFNWTGGAHYLKVTAYWNRNVVI